MSSLNHRCNWNQIKQLLMVHKHKIGKLRIIKRERAWWDYAQLFAVGVIQFVAGAAICAQTGGFAIPIRFSLMTAKISDMVKAVYSAWNDLQIDWGKWGKDKVISLTLTLVQAGPSALSELWNGIQSMQTVSISDIIKEISEIMVDGTINAGLYVGEQCMEQLRQVTETFLALEDVDLVIRKLNIRNKFKNVIRDIMIKYNMPKKVADQILEIAQEALIQSQIPGSQAMENELFLKI